ncbi:hypothetical protein HNY73_015470 [Argiope bruennichi]|uniref:Uncharacterized protein n=1 Tax=Argiope bruennichi TaxID=94029 RepID=A0A8T0ETL8_ARGBR|nr:hypothetical protein HNY73_015470 [Argiope bruennichi]
MEGTTEERDSSVSKRSKSTRQTRKPVKKTSNLRNQVDKERIPQESAVSPRCCPHEENDEDDETSANDDIQNESISKEGNAERSMNRKHRKKTS